ncbi:Cytosolic 5'-nucleotidase 3A [Araneus ventricosus]|uniref:5'-nucleotidase n=1 Tax=Araneus ventricosus TaxID=182803 RepID=A0A4Y2BVU5_ARAVE|nr:Cytosolic 5'-nucleotidase 3A [Araneus ventricosus]
MLYSRVFQNHFLELSIGIGTVAIASLVTFHFIRKPRKKISRIIDTMDVFNKENVHIKNRDHVEEIVSQLIKGSASKLQIISDFDQTLSRIHKNGKQCATTYGIFKQSPLASDEYKKKSLGLFNHYHPIEVDPHLTKEEKEPYMIEWYTKSRNLMPSSGITKDCLPIMVEESNILLSKVYDKAKWIHSIHIVATAYSSIRSQPSCSCVVEESSPIKAQTLSVVFLF